MKNWFRKIKLRNSEEPNGRRRDGTREANLGHASGVAGSGADLASQDMEVANPSPS